MKGIKADKNLLILCITIVVVVIFGIGYQKESSVQIVNNTTTSSVAESSSKAGKNKTSGANKAKVSSEKQTSQPDDEVLSEELIYEEVNTYSYSNEKESPFPENNISDYVSHSEEVTYKSVQSYTDNIQPQIKSTCESIASFTHISVTVCSYSQKVCDMVSVIYEDMSLLENEIFDGIYNKGYSIKVNIVDYKPDGEYAKFYGNGKDISISVCSLTDDFNTYFTLEFAKACEYMLSQNADIDKIYSDFSSLNPKGFTYGEYSPNYIGKNDKSSAFLNIESQQSIYLDRVNLLGLYLCNYITHTDIHNSMYLPDKLNAVLSDLKTYLA